MGKRKSKKIKKRYKIFLAPVLGVAVFLLLFFILWKANSVPEHYVSISPESAKQGDTVLVKVSGKYPSVKGVFDGKEIVFFRNGNYSDWSALLGIDADIKPGEYTIFISASAEKMEKKINIAENNFASAKMASTEEETLKSVVKNDNPVLYQVIENFTPQAYFSGPFYFPLKKMQKSGFDFGEFIKSGSYLLQHFGVDLRASQGTEIFAVNDGKVVFAESLSNYGNTIVVDHGLGIYSLYLHLSNFDVSLGQNVKRGQQIGLSGSSGYSTAPHLHFSIRDNGARVDPLYFIENSQSLGASYDLASIKNAFLKLLK